ncbi:unnamed protein product [Mesocestoides corti]|uniref:RRM domain-containing protein n=1 Tax=Mesocestoides corti TaxID=53468 RepID=A0A0R3UKR0_MESCO|nr:unnamed protein product [Mesocestoides corti]
MALDAQGNEVGKLFVGGLHQSTNTNGLHNYFSKFGDIEESIVMMDNRTGRSRGFGYVKFKEPSAVDQVLSEKVHVIDNKEVDPKRYGSWNQWSHSGSGGNGVDIPGGVGGTSDNSWNHILNHHALTPWGSQLPPPWNGPASSAGNGPSSSPLNGCWDNQMAAAAAAAFQSNGFTSPQQQWGSQQSSNRRKCRHSLFHSGVPHHQNHPPSASDHFSQHNTVAGASCGASGGNFTSTWGVPSDTANQWGAGTGSSAALWGSGTTAATGCSRHDQNDSACSTGLGSATNLGVGTSVTAFKMDDDLYRAASGGGNTNVTGISFPGSGSDWQSALAVATVTAQQRSVLAAAAASQFKR